MEWRGVNLTNYRQQRWLKQRLFYISLTILTLFILLSTAYISYSFASSYEIKNKLKKANIAEKENYLNNIKQKITQQKHYQENKKTTEHIEKKHLLKVLHYLTQSSVKGGIETIYIFVEGKTKIKLIGKFIQQVQFQQLEESLKKAMFNYKIEHFQTNEKYQIEFNILIEME